MSRLLGFLGLLPAVLCLGACGSSSSHPTATSTAGAPPSSSTHARASSTASSAGTSGPQASTRTTSTAAAAPAGGAKDVRVPATFTILPGGALVPPTVSSPAFVAVALTLGSRDGRSHQVLLRTPRRHAFEVPAQGRATFLIPGLRAGRYVLDVDGMARGALLIGGEPGP